MFRAGNDRLSVESQTVSGLHAWRDNFEHVCAFAICLDELPPPGWCEVDIAELSAAGIDIIPLPDTYDLRTYLRERRAIGACFLKLMNQTRYHTFGYGGWIGDPGEIAAAAARRNGIPHAVWFDRVESQVVRTATAGGIKDKVKSTIKAAVIERHEKRAVRTATLSLLHGATVFDHFKGIAKNPCQVEDVHFTEEDRLSNDVVAVKAGAAMEGRLNILYCGRASRMKGPLDWVKVLIGLKQRGVVFAARWLGDGEMLDKMREAASEGGLTAEDLVFEGFVSDRKKVRDFYRQAHVMLFCHLTDESPRNLIESLHAATPLIGYRDLFSADLVSERGAGELVPRGAVGGLVDIVAGLDTNRARLAELITRAGASAEHLTRNQVFRHRSEIIRSQMPPAALMN